MLLPQDALISNKAMEICAGMRHPGIARPDFAATADELDNSQD